MVIDSSTLLYGIRTYVTSVDINSKFYCYNTVIHDAVVEYSLSSYSKQSPYDHFYVPGKRIYMYAAHKHDAVS